MLYLNLTSVMKESICLNDEKSLRTDQVSIVGESLVVCVTYTILVLCLQPVMYIISYTMYKSIYHKAIICMVLYVIQR